MTIDYHIDFIAFFLTALGAQLGTTLKSYIGKSDQDIYIRKKPDLSTGLSLNLQ